MFIKVTTTMKFFINENSHIVNLFFFTLTQLTQNLQYETKMIEIGFILTLLSLIRVL